MVTRGRERVGDYAVVTADDVFKPNTLYEFVYQLETRPWWGYLFWFIRFQPDNFAETLPEKIEEQSGIPKDEIKVYFWSYDEGQNIFRTQFKWIPKEVGIEPAIGILLGLVVISVAGAITSLIGYFSLRIIGEPTLQEIKEFVTDAVNKSLLYLDVLAGVVCFAYLTPLFLAKSKKGAKH